MNTKLIFLFFFLFLTACDSKNDIRKMDVKTAEQQFTCKDCVNVKIKLNNYYECLNSEKIIFPLYLKPLEIRIDISGFLRDIKDKNLITAVHAKGDNLFTNYLMGKWNQDDINGYGSANIYYNAGNDYVTLSVKKSIIDNNRESYIAEDINDSIRAFCEEYNDKNNWTYSKDLDNKNN